MEKINSKSSVEEFVRAYVQRGFGSMNKNDFEVWIFSQLMQERLRGKSNYDISLELRLPESKVKRLAYEAQLRYPSGVSYKEQLSESLKKAKMSKDDNYLCFPIENIALRNYLSNILKNKGSYIDSSFNFEIVKINVEDFAIILEAVDAEVANKLKEEHNKQNIKEVFTDIVKNFGGQAIGELVCKGVDDIVEVAKKYINKNN
ncbi:MAG: hypothetical protein MJZ15_03175 [Bacteroidales bacterium]|nr:hypothetical protein [Bacteroidales bacterium]